MEAPDRLDSWKEIAAYLKRDVRTVQRWEAFESLPIHRHQHKKRGSVHALRDELDAWRESRSAELFGTPDPEEAVPQDVPAATPVDIGVVWKLAVPVAAAAIILAAALLTRDSKAPVVNATPSTAMDAPRLLGEVTREGGVIERIPLRGTAYSVLLSPDEKTLYVSTCGQGTTVQAIDTATRTVRWSVDLKCAKLVLDNSGRRLIAAEGADIVIVDAETAAVRRIATPASTISDLALMPDDVMLYAAAVFKGLLAIDTVKGEVRTISHLPCPASVALTPAGDRLYVGYQCAGPGGTRGHDAIDVVDTRTQKSVAIIKGLPHVGGDMALTVDGSHLWADGLDACHSAYYDHVGCPSGTGAIINVIRTSDHMLVRSLRIGGPDEYNAVLSMTPDGTRVLLGRVRTSVASTANLREMESVPLLLGSAAFARSGRVVYAVLGDERSVAILPVARHPAPPAGLTARWTMDGLAVDAVAENNFANVGDDNFVPGRIGRAVRVTDLPLRLSHPPNVNIDAGLVTAMAWVKLEALSGATAIIEYESFDSRGPSGWRVSLLPDGRAAVCMGFRGPACEEPGTALFEGKTPLRPGAWHHVAFTRADRKVSLYVDGRLEATGTHTDGLPNINNTQLRLGSDEFGMASLAGLLDEIEIYNRALSADEIADRIKVAGAHPVEIRQIAACRVVPHLMCAPLPYDPTLSKGSFMGAETATAAGPAVSARDLTVPYDFFIIPDGDRYLVYAPFSLGVASVDADTARRFQDVRDGKATFEGYDEEYLRSLVDAGILTTRKHAGERPAFHQKTAFDPQGITLFLTTKCSLGCTYCYASANDRPSVMSWETARTAVDWMFRHAQRQGRNHVSLMFHGGGEVTVALDVMKQVVAYARAEAAAKQMTVSVGAGLNGVMKGPVLEWVIANVDNATVSFDGLPDIHNAQRPLVNGKESFSIIAEALKRMDQAGFDYGLRVTVTRIGIDRMAEAVDFICREFQAKVIQIEPVSRSGRARATDVLAPDPMQFVAQFRKARPIARRYGRELKYSGARFGTIANKFCQVSDDLLAVTPDGFLSACYEVGQPDDPRADTFFYGRLNTAERDVSVDMRKVIHLRTLTVEHKQGCDTCFCRWSCAGECSAKLADAGDAWDARDHPRCDINRALTLDQMKAYLEGETP